MAKARKAVPCEVSKDCCLLESHNGSCIFWRSVPRPGHGWDIIMFRPGGEVVDTIELTEEPTEDQVRAGAAFMYDPRKLPGRLMQKLPELRGTVYGDVSGE